MGLDRGDAAGIAVTDHHDIEAIVEAVPGAVAGTVLGRFHYHHVLPACLTAPAHATSPASQRNREEVRPAMRGSNIEPRIVYDDLRQWMAEADRLGELRTVTGASWQEDIGRVTEILLKGHCKACRN